MKFVNTELVYGPIGSLDQDMVDDLKRVTPPSVHQRIFEEVENLKLDYWCSSLTNYAHRIPSIISSFNFINVEVGRILEKHKNENDLKS